MTSDEPAEGLLSAYLAQHSYMSHVHGESFVVEVSALDVPELPFGVCKICGTRVTRRGDAGWRHDEGFAARGGCTVAYPDQGFR